MNVFQTMQSVKVIKGGHDRFGQAGCVVRQDKGKVTVRMDVDRAEVDFDYSDENQTLQAL